MVSTVTKPIFFTHGPALIALEEVVDLRPGPPGTTFVRLRSAVQPIPLSDEHAAALRALLDIREVA